MTAPLPAVEQAVAGNIRRFREAAGWSQAETSERAIKAGYDLGEMAVWSIEKHRRRIRVEDLFAFADVFGSTPQRLLESEAAPEATCSQYEVRFDGGVTESIAADSVDWGKDWVRFLRHGEPVYAAAASRVLGIRTVRGQDEKAAES